MIRASRLPEDTVVDDEHGRITRLAEFRTQIEKYVRWIPWDENDEEATGRLR